MPKKLTYKYLSVAIVRKGSRFIYAIGYEGELVPLNNWIDTKMFKSRQHAHQFKESIKSRYGDIEYRVMDQNLFDPEVYIDSAMDRISYLKQVDVSEFIFGDRLALAKLNRKLTVPEAKLANKYSRKVRGLLSQM